MYQILREILFALSRKDAEQAHDIVCKSAVVIQNTLPFLLPLIRWHYRCARNPCPHHTLGTVFPNRVGLAAGFDKDAKMLLLLQELGFGFIEFGTVLPDHQMGNPRPRMFRIPSEGVIINRMGFNSEGAEAVAQRLEQIKGRMRIPLLGSVGKMKDTPNERAVDDFAMAWGKIRSHANIAVINVSSPNTPGLRDLQHAYRTEEVVREFVRREKFFAKSRMQKHKPVLVKLASDFDSDAAFIETLEAVNSGGASGLIIGNTTLKRPVPSSMAAAEAGGLSGKPLYPLNLHALRVAKKAVPRLPVIYCGGIDCIDRAAEVFAAGTELVQIFTGLVYCGPSLIRDIRAIS